MTPRNHRRLQALVGVVFAAPAAVWFTVALATWSWFPAAVGAGLLVLGVGLVVALEPDGRR